MAIKKLKVETELLLDDEELFTIVKKVSPTVNCDASQALAIWSKYYEKY